MSDYKKQGSQSCTCGNMPAHTHGKDESKAKDMDSKRQERNESKDRREVK